MLSKCSLVLLPLSSPPFTSLPHLPDLYHLHCNYGGNGNEGTISDCDLILEIDARKTRNLSISLSKDPMYSFTTLHPHARTYTHTHTHTHICINNGSFSYSSFYREISLVELFFMMWGKANFLYQSS